MPGAGAIFMRWDNVLVVYCRMKMRHYPAHYSSHTQQSTLTPRPSYRLFILKTWRMTMYKDYWYVFCKSQCCLESWISFDVNFLIGKKEERQQLENCLFIFLWHATKRPSVQSLSPLTTSNNRPNHFTPLGLGTHDSLHQQDHYLMCITSCYRICYNRKLNLTSGWWWSLLWSLLLRNISHNSWNTWLNEGRKLQRRRCANRRRLKGRVGAQG